MISEHGLRRCKKANFKAVWAGPEGTSPYNFYKWLMSPETVQPKDALASSNWHRFGLKAALPPLEILETETDDKLRYEAGVKLQRLFATHFPAIPLFANPAWGAFNTKRFEGFPSQGQSLRTFVTQCFTGGTVGFNGAHHDSESKGVAVRFLLRRLGLYALAGFYHSRLTSFCQD